MDSIYIYIAKPMKSYGFCIIFKHLMNSLGFRAPSSKALWIHRGNLSSSAEKTLQGHKTADARGSATTAADRDLHKCGSHRHDLIAFDVDGGTRGRLVAALWAPGAPYDTLGVIFPSQKKHRRFFIGRSEEFIRSGVSNKPSRLGACFYIMVL